MNLLRECNLPVFSDEYRLFQGPELKDDIGSYGPEVSSVVRYCHIDTEGLAVRSLAELLRLTEDQFKILEDRSGISVVPHVWGLYPLSSSDSEEEQRNAAKGLGVPTHFNKYQRIHPLLPK